MLSIEREEKRFEIKISTRQNRTKGGGGWFLYHEMGGRGGGGGLNLVVRPWV